MTFGTGPEIKGLKLCIIFFIIFRFGGLDWLRTDVLGCWRSILIFDNGERLSHRRGAFCSFSFLLIDSNEIKYLE